MLNKIKKGVKNLSSKGMHFLLNVVLGFEGGSAPSPLLQIYGDVTFGSCKSTICFLASFSTCQVKSSGPLLTRLCQTLSLLLKLIFTKIFKADFTVRFS